MTENLDRREMTLRQKLSIPEASDTPWRAIDATVVVLALLVSLILIGPSIVLLTSDDVTGISPFLLMLGWTIGQVITIAFVVINRRSSVDSWRALRLDVGLVPQPIAALVGVAIALTTDLITSLPSSMYLPVPEIFGLQADNLTSIIIAALFLVVVQPIAESLVFQGVLLPKLRVIMGAWGGVVMTTVIFTLIHYGVFYASYPDAYPQGAMIWYGIAYPLVFGLTFSLLKVYAQSTRAVILGRVGAGMTLLLTALIVVS